MTEWRPPPPGWFILGEHVDQDVELEFSDEVSEEDGYPLWERPIS